MTYKILVVGPSWIGDTVLAQPLLRRLHQRHADLSVDVLAPGWTLPLLRRMPEVAQAIPSPFGHGELQLSERRALARRLRADRYDQAIVLPNSFKSALIPWLARIPLRTGYVGEFRYPLLNDARRLDDRALPKMAERYAALGQPAGEALVQPLPALHLQIGQHDSLLHRLQLSASAPIACLCPGAEYGPAKRWPAVYFAELARRLESDGHQVAIVGSQKDREIGAQIEQLTQQAARNFCGQTTLDEAIDLLSAARLCVSNDSGLMHVAAAVGTPLLALYGSSSPGFTPPLSDNAVVLKLDLPCSPCYKRECPLQHFNCMMQLTPDQVYAATARLPALRSTVRVDS
jgi:heptosyltransferase II